MSKKEDDYYDKKIDNGLKKKELEEKYGAHFSEFNELPPEMENQWLNSIQLKRLKNSLIMQKLPLFGNIWISLLSKRWMN